MAKTLFSIIPDAETLLALEPEQLAVALLELLDGNQNFHPNNVIQKHIIQEYPHEFHDAILKALMEAWSWLVHERLVAPKPGPMSQGWYFVTRRGQEFKDSSDSETLLIGNRNMQQQSKIFIVHGRNHGIRNEIDLFIRNLGLQTVVMDAAASSGRTLPEKFEELASECQFAVFILSADDDLTDHSNNERIKRARQNVILEVGYFWGALGRRGKVAFLVESGTELPSDIQGIGWIPITADLGTTKLELRRELEEVGLLGGNAQNSPTSSGANAQLEQEEGIDLTEAEKEILTAAHEAGGTLFLQSLHGQNTKCVLIGDKSFYEDDIPDSGRRHYEAFLHLRELGYIGDGVTTKSRSEKFELTYAGIQMAEQISTMNHTGLLLEGVQLVRKCSKKERQDHIRYLEESFRKEKGGWRPRPEQKQNLHWYIARVSSLTTLGSLKVLWKRLRNTRLTHRPNVSELLPLLLEKGYDNDLRQKISEYQEGLDSGKYTVELHTERSCPLAVFDDSSDLYICDGNKHAVAYYENMKAKNYQDINLELFFLTPDELLIQP